MGVAKKIADWLIGEASSKPVKTRKVVARFAHVGPSLADNLGFVDFCDERNLFLLTDGVSVGSGFELGDISAESTSPEHLQAVFSKVRDTFANVVPLQRTDPWVMQMFVQDDYSVQPIKQHIERAIAPEIRETAFTQDYLSRLGDLLDKMARPQGLFPDPATAGPFRARRRRIRVLFYRRYQQLQVTREQAIQEHEEVIAQITEKLVSPGLALKRLTAKAAWHWLVSWFNPEPKLTDGDTTQLLERFPYPISRKPAGFMLSQNIFFSHPESDSKGFVFDGLPHRILYVDGLREAPETGLISREKPQANPKHRYALLDRLPEGSLYTIQVVFAHDDALDAHLSRIEKGILGTSLKPREVRDDIRVARDELATGNRLFWVNQAVYYRGRTDEELLQTEKTLKNLFIDAKMPLIDSCFDLHPLNSYLNALPFGFCPEFARRHLCYDRLMYASELAALLPVYGRNQGARHLPCFVFFNRLGEPVFYDVLHNDFVSQNSHMAIFANSGSGKSVLTGWQICSLMAVKNARIVLFEMGNSFDRLLMHCRAKGKQVKQLLLSRQKDKAVPLNPFCDAYKALDEIRQNLDEETAARFAEKLVAMKASLRETASSEDEACSEEGRSWLAEMAMALRTMITEANEREEDAFTLADETLLIEILGDAILTSFQNNIPQMLTEHVLLAFERRLKTETSERKKDRIQDMCDRLRSYVINADKARFFNVPTEPLDDFDIFHIDISAIREDRGKLALVMISLLPRILALAERTQHEERPTFLMIDEAHLQFDVDVIVAVCLLIAKVARKLGLWLVPITQNVADMKSEKATKILSLIETWILLGINEKELTDVKQFKPLTPEHEALIRGIASEKGVYSEAVLLGSRYQGLFRVIPPRYLLALLLTEKSEKAERHALESQLDALEAAEIVARQLESRVRPRTEEHCFYED